MLTEAKSGGSVDFDGENDYATMPTNGFNISSGTVEAWSPAIPSVDEVCVSFFTSGTRDAFPLLRVPSRR